ncbi:MAG: hypothetical protein HKN12_05500 [Gemmatimonadetes bacterium]|nr:hypothetical protein [Gemmatimonadota bacterium]
MLAVGGGPAAGKAVMAVVGTVAMGLVAAPGPAVAASTASPILRHEVDVTLNVAENRLDAVDRIRVAAPASGEPVRFLLNRELDVRAVRTGGRDLDFQAHDRWFPRHFWRRPPFADLGEFEAAREIEVPEPPVGWSAGVLTVEVEYGGVIADSLHSPERAYGRSFETTTGRIVERGAYLTGSTFWVPWSGDGLFPFEMTVSVPEEWRSVSQGRAASDAVERGRRVTRWVSAHPTDQIFLIAGPYDLHERPHGDVTVQAYVYPITGEDIVAPYLESTGAVLDRYSERFGAYPYAKFALVENYWQTGFGMPSFTFLGDRVIRLPFIVDTSYPHEILHNWWGNGVYLRRGEGNWCEGLTTHGADYAAKEREDPNAARDYRRSTLQSYRDFALAGGKDFPLRGFRERDSAATQAVGYGKTLMVFHMLQRRLGADMFDASLERFFREQRFRRAGWDELRAAFEAESGEDLVPFFAQWVDRAGAPAWRLEDVKLGREGGGPYQVHGVLVQDAPAYDVTLPLLVTNEDGAHLRHEVRCTGERTPFRVDVRFTPDRVSADPDFETFRRLHPEESPAALSAVLGAPAVRIVIGNEVSGTMRSTLLEIAEEWGRDSAVVVVEEPAGHGELPDFAGGTWFFGEGHAAHEREALLGAVHLHGSGTVVAAAREAAPGGTELRPLGFFLPDDPESAPSVARKIHHYSKYSWLVFDGDRNTDKSFWEPGLSPLTVKVR